MEKVIVEIICPYCKNKLALKKDYELTSKIITCPNIECKHKLNITFDINKDPQEAHVAITEKIDKKKTVHKKKINPKDISFDDDDDNLSYFANKKKKIKLKHNIFLTQIMWFGLKNESYQLFEGTTTIGRFQEGEESDISIKGDNTISRKSIAIIIDQSDGVFDYKLRVLNATNPVRVNEQVVHVGEEVYLDFDDIIYLGRSKFKFEKK